MTSLFASYPWPTLPAIPAALSPESRNLTLGKYRFCLGGHPKTPWAGDMEEKRGAKVRRCCDKGPSVIPLVTVLEKQHRNPRNPTVRTGGHSSVPPESFKRDLMKGGGPLQGISYILSDRQNPRDG